MNHSIGGGKQLPAPSKKFSNVSKGNVYHFNPYGSPNKADKRYIICPLCSQKVHYARRAAHRCFKFHLSEIERNVRQMNRD